MVAVKHIAGALNSAFTSAQDQAGAFGDIAAAVVKANAPFVKMNSQKTDGDGFGDPVRDALDRVEAAHQRSIRVHAQAEALVENMDSQIGTQARNINVRFYDTPTVRGSAYPGANDFVTRIQDLAWDTYITRTNVHYNTANTYTDADAPKIERWAAEYEAKLDALEAEGRGYATNMRANMQAIRAGQPNPIRAAIEGPTIIPETVGEPRVSTTVSDIRLEQRYQAVEYTRTAPVGGGPARQANTRATANVENAAPDPVVETAIPTSGGGRAPVIESAPEAPILTMGGAGIVLGVGNLWGMWKWWRAQYGTPEVNKVFTIELMPRVEVDVVITKIAFYDANGNECDEENSVKGVIEARGLEPAGHTADGQPYYKQYSREEIIGQKNSPYFSESL